VRRLLTRAMHSRSIISNAGKNSMFEFFLLSK
jgi:hypothetical protein